MRSEDGNQQIKAGAASGGEKRLDKSADLKVLSADSTGPKGTKAR